MLTTLLTLGGMDIIRTADGAAAAPVSPAPAAPTPAKTAISAADRTAIISGLEKAGAEISLVTQHLEAASVATDAAAPANTTKALATDLNAESISLLRKRIDSLDDGHFDAILAQFDKQGAVLKKDTATLTTADSDLKAVSTILASYDSKSLTSSDDVRFYEDRQSKATELQGVLTKNQAAVQAAVATLPPAANRTVKAYQETLAAQLAADSDRLVDAFNLRAGNAAKLMPDVTPASPPAGGATPAVKPASGAAPAAKTANGATPTATTPSTTTTADAATKKLLADASKSKDAQVKKDAAALAKAKSAAVAAAAAAKKVNDNAAVAIQKKTAADAKAKATVDAQAKANATLVADAKKSSDQTLVKDAKAIPTPAAPKPAATPNANAGSGDTTTKSADAAAEANDNFGVLLKETDTGEVASDNLQALVDVLTLRPALTEAVTTLSNKIKSLSLTTTALKTISNDPKDVASANITKALSGLKSRVASIEVYSEKQLPDLSNLLTSLNTTPSSDKTASSAGSDNSLTSIEIKPQIRPTQAFISKSLALEKAWRQIADSIKAGSSTDERSINTTVQSLHTHVALLTSLLNLVEDGLDVNRRNFVASQVRLFYFTDVPRILKALNPDVHSSDDVDAPQKAADDARKALLDAQAQIAAAYATVNDNSTQTQRLKADLKAAQAQAKQAQREADQAANVQKALSRRQDNLTSLGTKVSGEITNQQTVVSNATSALALTNSELSDQKSALASASAADKPAIQAKIDALTATQNADQGKLDHAQKVLQQYNDESDGLKQRTTNQGYAVDDAQDNLTAARARVSSLQDQLVSQQASADQAQVKLSAAQSQLAQLRTLSQGLAQAEVEAFAKARDNAPFLIAPADPASSDPARRVIMFGYPDSSTILIRGTAQDVDLVKEIISGFDRPAPQARLSLYTLQLNVSDDSVKGFRSQSFSKVNNAIANIDNVLRGLRGNLTLVQDTLRDSIVNEVNRRAAIAGIAANAAHSLDSNKAFLFGRVARYFYYPPEIRRELGFTAEIPSLIENLAESEYEIRLAGEYLSESARIRNEIVKLSGTDDANLESYYQKQLTANSLLQRFKYHYLIAREALERAEIAASRYAAVYDAVAQNDGTNDPLAATIRANLKNEIHVEFAAWKAKFDALVLVLNNYSNAGYPIITATKTDAKNTAVNPGTKNTDYNVFLTGKYPSSSDKGSDDAPSDKGSDDAPSDKGSDDAPSDKGSDDVPSDKGSDDVPSDKGSDDVPSDKGSGGNRPPGKVNKGVPPPSSPKWNANIALAASERADYLDLLIKHALYLGDNKGQSVKYPLLNAMPTQTQIRDLEGVTRWTLPDPVHATTLGEMLFVLSLGKHSAREGALSEYQAILDNLVDTAAISASVARAKIKQNASQASMVKKSSVPQLYSLPSTTSSLLKEWAQDVDSNVGKISDTNTNNTEDERRWFAMRRFAASFSSVLRDREQGQVDGGDKASPTLYPFFNRTILGAVASHVSLEDDDNGELTANQLEILNALQVKARETVAREVKTQISLIGNDAITAFSSGVANSDARASYLPLVGWLNNRHVIVDPLDNSVMTPRDDYQPSDRKWPKGWDGSQMADGATWYSKGRDAVGAAGNWKDADDPLHLHDMDLAAWEIADRTAKHYSLSRAIPRVAAADDMIKRLIVVTEDDFDEFFVSGAMDEIRRQATTKGVQLGVVQKESILATNRLVARVDPNANADAVIGNDNNVLDAAAQLGQLAHQYDQEQRAQKLTTNLPIIGALGVAAKRGRLGGAGNFGVAALGFSMLGDLLSQPQEPEGEIYSINTGNLFQVTPIFDPSGQALRFKFDYSATTNVTEPNGTTNRQIPRVERHSVNTEVQISNLEFREISRFESNVRIGTPSQRQGGLPFFRDIPVIRDIPILGYYVKRGGTAATRQESLIFAQTSMYPTVGDIADLLTNAPITSDVDPDKPAYLNDEAGIKPSGTPIAPPPVNDHKNDPPAVGAPKGPPVGKGKSNKGKSKAHGAGH